MREILFRGKRKDNGEWIEGFLTICDDRCFIIENGKVGCLCFDTLPKGNYVFMAYIEVDPDTIGQFTGLTDKNGKRIFEGDICRVCLDPEICIAHIQYDERTASFNMRYDDYLCNTFLDMRLAENRVGDRVWIEVIGNIHDNPELLGGGG